jgi:hypothetical protein
MEDRERHRIGISQYSQNHETMRVRHSTSMTSRYYYVCLR